MIVITGIGNMIDAYGLDKRYKLFIMDVRTTIIKGIKPNILNTFADLARFQNIEKML